MKTYFEYEELERANMKEDFVRSLLDAELMVTGVLKVDAPVYRTVPELPVLHKEKYFKVHNIYFKTVEQAQKFIELDPLDDAYLSSVGYDRRYAKPYGSSEYSKEALSIKQEELLIESEITQHARLLGEIRGASEFNNKLRQDFDKASSAMDKVLNGVWEDWGDLQSKKNELASVANTFDSYVKTAGGDIKTASQFVLKVLSPDKLKMASEWLNRPDIWSAVEDKVIVKEELATV